MCIIIMRLIVAYKAQISTGYDVLGFFFVGTRSRISALWSFARESEIYDRMPARIRQEESEEKQWTVPRWRVPKNENYLPHGIIVVSFVEMNEYEHTSIYWLLSYNHITHIKFLHDTKLSASSEFYSFSWMNK